MEVDTELKICRDCTKIKLIDDFYRRGTNGGRLPWCKVCFRERYPIKKGQKSKYCLATVYEKKYNLPKREAADLASNRIGLCEICMKSAKLVIDHNHTTGDMRGRLCNTCNVLLGTAKDSIDLLKSAISYLARNEY